MKALVKGTALFAIHQLGGIELFRWKNRRALRILYYHRFESPARSFAPELERQLQHLSDHYSFVSIEEVAQWFGQGYPLPPNPVLLTVDDGHGDSYRVAFPLFRKYGAKPLIYTVASFVEQNNWLWWNAADFLITQTSLSGLFLELSTGPLKLNWKDGERAAQTSLLCQKLKEIPNSERCAVMTQLPIHLKTDLPPCPPPHFAALRWDQIREMRKAGVSFGAHTLTHPILPRVESIEEIRAELVASRRLLEDRLQTPVEHFCYPNGSYDERCEAEVVAAGYRTAATCIPGMNPASVSPLRLKRDPLDPGTPAEYFRRLLAGAVKTGAERLSATSFG